MMPLRMKLNWLLLKVRLNSRGDMQAPFFLLFAGGVGRASVEELSTVSSFSTSVTNFLLLSGHIFLFV